MNYTTFEEAMKQAGLPVEVDAFSVYRAFTDPGWTTQTRSPLQQRLDLDLDRVGQIGGDDHAGRHHRVGTVARRVVDPGAAQCRMRAFPAAATYSNVLRALDAQQVTQVLNNLLTRVERCNAMTNILSPVGGAAEGEQQVHVALDGKTLRGTLGHAEADQKKMHQLTLYDTQTGVLLKEQVTGEKQNELSIVSQFLTPLLVKGRIISANALHTQHAFCFTVTRWDGDYVLIAKDNQATLADDLRLFFTEPPHDCRDWRTARTVNKGHGRLEIRELVAHTELNEFLGGQWAGVAHVFQLTRTVYEDGHMRREVVYGVTSLSPTRASAARLLALVRAHWRIENRLHWRRDVTLREGHLSSPQRRGSSHPSSAQQVSC